MFVGMCVYRITKTERPLTTDCFGKTFLKRFVKKDVFELEPFLSKIGVYYFCKVLVTGTLHSIITCPFNYH